MRLLNIDTLRLESFYEDDIPLYAILSHRWGKHEMTYTKIFSGKRSNDDGYKKILNFCDTARRRSEDCSKEYQYVWVDTCCIDKRDSAEVSESINSMFDYYAQSSECFVYLNDVSPYVPGGIMDSDTTSILYKGLGGSTWFSRGWTLQELLAPSNVLFFDAGWNLIGHKCWYECPCSIANNSSSYGIDLTPMLSSITGIAVEYLKGLRDVVDATIACRMSWAWMRTTKRQEDQAYCLQGLFDVKMPIIYGEGRSRAFLRLQEELLKQSKDQSIFAWIASPEPPNWPKTHVYARALLAPSSFAFIGSSDVQSGNENGTTCTLKNKGIKLRAQSQRALYRKGSRSMTVFIIQLNCTRSGTDGSRVPIEIAITDGTTQDEPTRISVFRRVLDSDLGHSIDRIFHVAFRQQPVERTFYVEGIEDGIIPLPKL